MGDKIKKIDPSQIIYSQKEGDVNTEEYIWHEMEDN